MYKEEKDPNEHNTIKLNGKIPWRIAPRALTGDVFYEGTEKSSGYGAGYWKNNKQIYKPLSSQVAEDLEMLLRSQFLSPSHYAHVLGKEYGQTGIAIYYVDEYGSFLFVEDIKMGE